MRERMRQKMRVRKFAFEWFLFITVGLPICHVSVILFKMGDNWRLLNRGGGAEPIEFLYWVFVSDFVWILGS